MLVRKSILIDEDDWKALNILKELKKTKEKNISISKIIQNAVKKVILEEEEKSLVYKMRLYSEPMDSTEEEDLLRELSEMTKDELEISEIDTFKL